MALVFESDPVKAALNLKNRGISFETAEEAFRDPNQVVLENYCFAEDGEQRYQIVGMTEGLLLLLVIFVDRSNATDEIIRIVSARKANAYEESIYEEQFTA